MEHSVTDFSPAFWRSHKPDIKGQSGQVTVSNSETTSAAKQPLVNERKPESPHEEEAPT